MTGDFEASRIDISVDVMNWMKNHTLRDLRDIALEIEEDGENADEVWAFIRELESYRSEGVMELKSSPIVADEPVHA